MQTAEYNLRFPGAETAADQLSRRKRQSTLTAPTALPPALCRRLEEILGEADMQAWRDSTPPRAVAARVNTLRGSAAGVQSGLRAEGLSPSPIAWLPEAFTVPRAQRSPLIASRAVAEGLVYVQNLSSMLPPLCLDVAPGMEILDLAAAPGSKTLQLAALMGNEGRLAAVERSRPRFHKLRANCRRAGAGCVRFYQKDGVVVGGLTPERFDRVLVDAPCSSEARIRSDDPATAAGWSEKKIRRLSGLQRRLLISGLRALKPGGLLVYSTCTFAPEENEAVVDSVLSRHRGALELLPLRLPIPNVRAGLTSWRGADFDRALESSARVVPDGVMEGFYLALFRKTGSLAASG